MSSADSVPESIPRAGPRTDEWFALSLRQDVALMAGGPVEVAWRSNALMKAYHEALRLAPELTEFQRTILYVGAHLLKVPLPPVTEQFDRTFSMGSRLSITPNDRPLLAVMLAVTAKYPDRMPDVIGKLISEGTPPSTAVPGAASAPDPQFENGGRE